MFEAIDAQVDAMMEADLIEPAQSDWASNVVMVRKADGSLRFCVDYRQLNERTVKVLSAASDRRLLRCTGRGYLVLDVLGPDNTRLKWIPRTPIRRRS